jgi:hypothetical protein
METAVAEAIHIFAGNSIAGGLDTGLSKAYRTFLTGS